MKRLLSTFVIILITVRSFSQNNSDALRKLKLDDISVYGNYNLNTNFSISSSVALLLYKKYVAAGFSTRQINENFGFGVKSIITIPLFNDGYICHVIFSETWVPFYAGGSFDYFPKLSSIVITPEIGYNFRISNRFLINTNINYIFPGNNRKEVWGKIGHLNLGLGLVYKLAKYVGPFEKW